MSVSLYWQNHGKTEADRRPGKTFQRSDGSLGCAECCTKMITQVDCDCYHRDSCPHCMGTGQNASCLPAYEEDPREGGDPPEHPRL